MAVQLESTPEDTQEFSVNLTKHKTYSGAEDKFILL